MSQYTFGTGQLFTTPVGGGNPLRLGALQDVSVDFSGDIKQLFGQYQFALDTARGKTKVEWKASSGNIDVNAFNTVFFGQSINTAGDELIHVIAETGTVPAMTTYTVTVAHAADFYLDLGVKLASTGASLKQVAAAPGAGEYTVAAGVYTFNVAQASAGVLIDYLYESASTGGSMEISNLLMGNTPTFQMVLTQVYDGKTFTLVLYKAVADKLSMPLKQDDYLIADLSGQCMANDVNKVGRLTTTSVSGGGA